ncbi:MAG: histidine kinase [Lachnospiraceae bacterium]|nr:histidine kinase [Lachnospiraceae bacterium]MDY3224157.1 histidine kinase [Lachnospiraceae bacterium]
MNNKVWQINPNSMTELNIGLLLFAAIVTVFLLIGAGTDQSRSRVFMKCFIGLLLSVIAMLLGEAGIWFWEGDSAHLPLLKCCAFLSFGCKAAVNCLFAYCQVGAVKERKNVSWKYAHMIAGICGAFILLVILSLFNGMLFFFDTKGVYREGSWYIIAEIVDWGTLLLGLAMVIGYRKILTKKGTLTMLAFSVLPMLSLAVFPDWNPTPMYIATTLSLILVYTLFHGELTRQLAEKERLLAENEYRLAENERQLVESRILITLSQLKPHFLYNVLNTIYYLCARDPKLVQRILSNWQFDLPIFLIALFPKPRRSHRYACVWEASLSEKYSASNYPKLNFRCTSAGNGGQIFRLSPK